MRQLLKYGLLDSFEDLEAWLHGGRDGEEGEARVGGRVPDAGSEARVVPEVGSMVGPEAGCPRAAR